MYTRFVFTIKLLAMTAIFMLLQQTAHAQNRGWFLSTGWNQNDINGDFDGNLFLTGGSDILTMPSLKAGNGISIFIGKQFANESGSWSVGYSESKHTSDWVGIAFDAVFKRYTLTELQVYTSKGNIRPYILLNLNYEHLLVENGSFMIANNDEVFFADESFYGGTLGLGFGLQADLAKIFSVSTHVSRIFGGFNKVKGIIDTEKVKIDKVSSSGWQLRLALNIYFTSK